MALAIAKLLAGLLFLFSTPLCHGQGFEDRVVPQSTSSWPPASLTFVMDTTGSMFDDIKQVKQAANAIFEAVLSKPGVPVQNFVLVPFSDPDVGPVTVTRSTEIFKNALDYLYIDGGGDCEEMAVSAIKVALEESLPGSFVFVFTDASAKDFQQSEMVVSLIQATRSTVVFVLTGDCGYRHFPEYLVYGKIATVSKGKIFQLDKKRRVGPVLKYINVMVAARLVSVVYRVNLPSGTQVFSFPVDSCLLNLIITVATNGLFDELALGENEPDVLVTGPDGRHNFSLIVDEKSVKVFHEPEPLPGQWQVEVKSNLEYSIYVDGRSFCDFQTSFFYALTPNVFYQRPIKDKKANVFLKPTVPPVDELEIPACGCTGAFVTHIRFLQLTGEVIDSVNFDWNVSHPFQVSAEHRLLPPNDAFIVMVSGRDERGYDFHRLSSSIVPGRADPPVPLRPETLLYWGIHGRPLVLPCPYRSTVSVMVEWRKDGVVLEASDDRYAQFDDGRLLIRHIAKDEDAGVYQCELKSFVNVLGFELNVSIAKVPTISLTPRELAVEEGGNGTFLCQTAGQPMPTIEWHMSGSKVSAYSPRYFIQDSLGVSQLGIGKVTSKDRGDVLCQARNLAGMTNETAVLEIFAGPRLVVSPLEMTVGDGDNVTFSCKVEGLPKPELDWYRGGSLLTSVTASDREKTLVLNAVIFEDQGVYTCVGRNDRGKYEESVELKIHSFPFFITKPEDLDIIAGKSAVFECIPGGNPPPEVSWLKDGRPILADNGRHLTLNNVQLKDRGTYACVATNIVGESRSLARLRLLIPPSIVPMPVIVRSQEDECVWLHCQANGDPRPVVSWFHGGKLLVQRLPKHRRHSNGTLRICELAEADAGELECRATNPAGNVTESTMLNVQFAPLLDRRLTDQWAVVGTEASLVCTVGRANPSALIYWKKNGIRIGLSGNVLHFDQVEFRDDGYYRCVAENRIGADSSSARLYVIVPARIIFISHSVTLVRGQSGLLECLASGIPQPDIMWMRDGKRILGVTSKYAVYANGTLKIRNSQLDDVGLYVCTAVNQGGNESKVASVDVQYAPFVVDISSSLLARVSTSVTLTCMGDGNPAPDLKWFKGEGLLPIGNEPNLTISSLQLSDAGEYLCTVTNILGEDRAKTDVIIIVPPYVVGSVIKVSVVRGESVDLPCGIFGTPKPAISWQFEEKNVSDLDPFKYQQSVDGTSLQVRNAQIMDGGTYRCEGRNIGGNVTSQVHLDVLYPPIVEKSPVSQSIIVGKCVWFECTAHGNPRPAIAWRKNGKLLRPSADIIVSPNKTQLSICPITRQSKGEIICRVKNKIGRIKASATLTVIIPTVIVSVVKEITGVVGRTAWLPCNATGLPSPTVSWTVNGTAIGDSSKYRTLLNGSLRVSDLVRNDAGVYVCTATNEGGENSTDVTLIIYYGPSVVTHPLNQVAFVGSTVSFHCQFDSRPAATVRWMKDVTPLTSNLSLLVSNDGTVLTVLDIRAHSAGQYSCIGENAVGRAVASATLRVLVPPRVVCTHKIVHAILDGVAWLPCSATGIPEPEIKWRKNQKELERISLKRQILSNGTLRIETIQKEDAGSYLITAENEGGKANAMVVLNVQYGPTITEAPVGQEALADSDIMLRCNASGNPRPAIIWKKEEHSLNFSSAGRFRLALNGRLLMLSDIRPADGGHYVCIAENYLHGSNGNTIHKVDSSLPATIVVLFAPVAVSETRFVTVTEGELVELPCQVDGFPVPIVDWFKRGTKILSSDFQLLRSGSLSSLAVKREHAGVYSCLASNKIGNITMKVSLDVLYAPDIVKMSSNQTIIVDKTLELVCRGESNPSPVVYWEFNGNRLANFMPGVSVNVVNHTSTVKVAGVQLDDAGRYSCRVENRLGTATEAVQIRVIEPPAFVSYVFHVSAPVGATAWLPCNVVGTPPPEIRWFRRGGVGGMDVIKGVRFSKLGNGTLRIADVRLSDAGSFQCVAVNEGGSVETVVDLDVQYPPSIFNVSKDSKVLLDHSIQLFCEASGNPQPSISWMYRSAFGTQTAVSHDRISSNGTLLILDVVQPRHAGTYICSAKNFLLEDRSEIRLFVIEPPVLIQEVKVVTAPKGGVAWLPCEVAGSPLPTVEWFDDAGFIAEGASDRHKVLQNRSLRIVDVKLDDAGSFACVATNEGGTVSTNVTLDVHYLPSVVFLSGNVTALEGSEVQFECRATGNPKPTVSWEFNRKRLGSGIGKSVGRLFLKDVRSPDRGTYTCLAENSVGVVERTTALQVVEFPKILRIEKNVIVDEKTTVWLPCVVTGNPRPTIVWSKNGVLLENESGRQYQMFQNGTLQIEEASPSDDALYRCTAVNEGGRDSATTNLTVLFGPEVSVSHRSVVVRKGADLVLTCKASGFPKPDIGWYRGQTRLSTSLIANLEIMLTLSQVSIDDEGEYVCVGRSERGRTESTVQLTVLVSPYFVARPNDTTALVSEMAVFRCVAGGNPFPEIGWERNGVLIRDSISNADVSADNQTLTLRNVQISDEVLYSCVAQNIAGQKRASALLTVIVLPSIRPQTHFVSVEVNHCLWLHCEADGYPLPVISWRLNGSLIRGGTHPGYDLFLNGTMRRCGITEQEAGTYTCVASNDGGEDSAHVQVDVLFQPVLANKLVDQWILLGTSVSFICVISKANPAASMAWTKDGRDAALPETSVDRLYIEKVQIGDAGIYQCTAENKIGRDISSSTLFVIVPPTIPLSTSKVVVLRGKEASLHCSSNGFPPPVLRWYKEDAEINPVVTTKHEILANGTLKIRNAQTDDAGKYRCLATNRGGNATNIVSLDVHYLPSVTTISDGQTVLINSSIFLTCAGNGNPEPSIKWIRSGVEVSSKASLLLSSVQPANTGLYFCVVENVVGSSNRSSSLQVIVPPRISPASTTVSVVAGNSALLRCHSSGIPDPVIEWRSNGSTVFSDGLKHVIGRDSSLEINNAQIDDDGVYACEATNDAGVDTAVRYLNVQYEPVMTKRPESRQVVVDQCVVFECNGDGNPKPVVFWERKGGHLSSGGNVQIFKNGTQLSMCPAKASDTGPYTCVVKNEVGHRKAEAHLQVNVPTSIGDFTIVVNGTVDGTAWLPCNATGIPPPVVSWFKGHALLADSHKYQLFPNGTLQVNQLATGDESEYRCLAVNEAGTNEKNITLYVHFPPSIVTPPKDQVVIASDNAVLRCVVTAHPEATITWRKDGFALVSNLRVAVSSDGQKLRIDDARPTDSGEYSCLAENYVGVVSESAVLRVNVPPRVVSTVNEVKVIRHGIGRLPCQSEGIPPPMTEWYRNGQPVGNDIEILPNGTLRFKDLETTESGPYVCVVRNEAGNDTITVFLDVQFGPSVVVLPVYQEVIADEDAVFSCEAQGNPKPDLSWSNGGRKMLIANESRYQILNGGERLTIFDVRPDDAGEYTCTGENVVTEAIAMVHEASATLNVIVSPTPDGTTSIVIALVGTRARIPCEVGGIPPPTFEWFRLGTEVSLLDDSNVLENGTLEIQAVRLADAGQYTCIATNKGGSLTRNVTLDVHYFASILSVPRNQSVLIGESLRLQCRADGNPYPNIQWKFKGAAISSKDGELFLKSVHPENSGVYTCVAENRYNQVQTSVKIDVLVPPSIVESVAKLTVDESSLARLTCVATGIPEPRIRWLKNGISIVDLREDRYEMLSNGTLLIHDSAVVDDAVYECEAENVAGKHAKNSTLKVKYGPIISARPSRVVIREGDVAVFNCSVEGFPLPLLDWYRGENVMKSAGGQLTVRDASVGDEGEYRCVGVNIRGQQEATVQLVVRAIPSIIQAPDNVSAMENSSVTFECDSNGNPSPSLSWKFQDEIVKSEKGKTAILSEGRRLTIFNAQTKDSGLYTCVAENLVGRDSSSASLFVIVPPSVFVEPEIIARQGETVDLLCRVSGVPLPNIAWTRSGKRIDSVSHKYEVLSNGTLKLRNIQRDDSDKYVCLATNIGGSSSGNVFVNVHYSPFIVNVSSNLSVLVNSDVELMCEGEGNPQPSFVWIKDGVEVTRGRRLNISFVQPSDAGVYTCSIENVVGADSSVVQLDVVVPATILESDVTVSVVLGRSALLPCTPSGIPKPTVEWLWKGLTIERGGSPKRFIHSNGTLQINNVQTDDDGIYECIASNVGGRDEIAVKLNVQFEPVMTSSPSNQSVIVGKCAAFTCNATGNPRPSFVWEKDGRRQTDGNSSSVHVSSDGTLLTVCPARVIDHGTYTCIARNEIGTKRRAATLRVIVPSRIAPSENEETGIVHQSVLLSCNASGRPRPSVSWFKGRRKIAVISPKYRLFPNGSLEVKDLLIEEAGHYRCVASNEGGKQEKNVTLFVHYQPVIVVAPQSQVAIIDTDVTFHCRASGNPSPVIEWKKGGNPLTFDSRVVESFDGNLSISDVRESDASEYSCIANNYLNATNASAELRVIVPATIIDGDEVVSAVRGSPAVLLDCQTQGTPSPVVEWKRNESSDLFGQKEKMRLLSNGSLEIRNLVDGDGGMYVCTATNEGGQVQKEVTLDVQYGPAFTRRPVSVEVLEGQDAVFKCSATGNPLPALRWEKDDGSSVKTTDRIKLLFDRQTLSVYDVRISDEGTYTCIAENDVTNIDETTRVSVHSSAGLGVLVPPSISPSPSLVVTVSGDPSWLPCNSYGRPNPSVSWLMGSGRPVEEMGHDVLENGTLRIGNTSLMAEGVFTCTATNKAGVASMNTTLDVWYPSRILSVPDRQSVLVGGNVTLECIAEGDPQPSLQWKYKGETIGEGGVAMSTPGQFHLVVTISEVKVSDAGDYSCIAKNDVSEDVRSTSIFVIAPPVFLPDSSVVTVIEKTTALLPCRVDGEPHPSVTWQNGGGSALLLPPGRWRVLSNDSLVIYSAEKEDARFYTCTASNDGGTITKRVKLNVLYSPQIIHISKRQYVQEGFTAVFQCQADGNPPPTITWRRKGNLLKNDSKTSISYSGNFLSVRNLRSEDAGRYACSAENSVGSVRAIARIEVDVPPKILQIEDFIEVREKMVMSLPCNVSGSPKPTVTWLFGNKTLPSGDDRITIAKGNLQIKDMSPDDMGTYHCQAGNRAGNSEATTTVSVLFIPRIIHGPGTVNLAVSKFAKNITIPCIAIGNPEPSIRWSYPRVVAVEGQANFLEIKREPGKLIVTNPARSDGEQYKCAAVNSIGSAVSVGFLRISN
eukprot:m.165733 g.165733  ORF g.165733 m.165733 type:complete len:5158 (+) comp38902_c0_seq1:154-15627(+)